jgi:hypothetical protein
LLGRLGRARCDKCLPLRDIRIAGPRFEFRL